MCPLYPQSGSGVGGWSRCIIHYTGMLNAHSHPPEPGCEYPQISVEGDCNIDVLII